MPRIRSRRPLAGLALAAAFAAPGPTGTATALPMGFVPDPAVPPGYLILIQEAGSGGTSGGGSTGGTGGTGGGGYGGGFEGGDPGGETPRDFDARAGTASIVSAVQPANATATALIVRLVEESTRACAATDPEYRVDCLATQFGDLARRLPRRGDYAAATQALTQVSAELAQIARANRDRTKPRISLRVAQPGAQPRRSAPFSAITPAAVPRANAQAAASVERLQATLLRSVPDNDPRDIHYQRIAASFNSSAVLLRS